MNIQIRCLRFIIRASFAMFVLLPLAASSSTDSAPHAVGEQQSNAGAVVFAVSLSDADEWSLDPVVLIEGGDLKPVFAELDEGGIRRFAEEYLRKGKKYRLLFGGGEAGTATVTGKTDGCQSPHGVAKLQTTARIRGRIMGLATDSDSLGRGRASARRALSSTERTAALSLVKSVYQQKGTTSALLALMQITNLTATDLDGDGKFEVIGSFTIETKSKARRDLFLIAEPQGAGYRAALVEYQSYQLPPEGFASNIDFVDQLDLDGDGTGEVLTINGGFDAYGYSIFRKQGGTWTRVYSGGGDAC